MYSISRKTAPRVKGGQVQFKHRWQPTPNYYNTELSDWIIDRQKPGSGYRHLVHQKELRQFLEHLPDWQTLRVGLDAVVLAPGLRHWQGWHRTGVVALTAWPRDFVETGYSRQFIEDHQRILDELRVPCKGEGDSWTMEFTESSARAFQLVHVLVHELGHHHDRMTTRKKRWPSRGEPFAENYANEYEKEILQIYWEIFPEDY